MANIEGKIWALSQFHIHIMKNTCRQKSVVALEPAVSKVAVGVHAFFYKHCNLPRLRCCLAKVKFSEKVP